MSHLERSPLDGIILGLLAAFVATNLAFLILMRPGSPLMVWHSVSSCRLFA
jgi:hypothetical protein